MQQKQTKNTPNFDLDITDRIIIHFCQQMLKREVPLDVVQVITRFYGSSKLWNLNEQIILKLANLKSWEKYTLSPTLHAYGAVFECRIYRDGLYLCYELSMISIPEHIAKMRIYFQLSCISTNTWYQGTKVLNSRAKGNKTWSSMPLQAMRWEYAKQAEFLCFLEVLQVQYKSNYINTTFVNYYKSFELQEKVKFVFERKSSIHNEFGNGTALMSQPFGGGGNDDNNCWWLICVIKENHDSWNNESPLQIYSKLKLFRLPHGMQEIYIDFKLKTDSKEIRYEHRKMKSGNILQINKPIPIISKSVKFTVSIKVKYV